MSKTTAGPKPAISVFIVDDHPLVRQGLRQLIGLEPDEGLGPEPAPAHEFELIQIVCVRNQEDRPSPARRSGFGSIHQALGPQQLSGRSQPDRTRGVTGAQPVQEGT